MSPALYCSRRIAALGAMVSQARRRLESPVARDPSRSRTVSMDARNDMLGRLQGRREGFTLPQPFYIDPAYFQLDMELIWYRDWLFVGHDCELTPGSFMTAQIGDYSVVLVRDLKGTIRALHNTCRHRGSRICAAEKGAAVRLR